MDPCFASFVILQLRSSSDSLVALSENIQQHAERDDSDRDAQSSNALKLSVCESTEMSGPCQRRGEQLKREPVESPEVNDSGQAGRHPLTVGGW